MNIDLGTFNITTDKLFADLVKTRTEIDKLKLVQKDLQKEFSNSNKSVAENQKAYNKLDAELKGLTSGSNAYNVKIAERQLAEENLNKSLLEQNKINDTYQTQLTQNQLALNQLTNQARGYQSVLDAQGRATNENIDSYTRERAELSLLQKEQRELGAVLNRLKNDGQENTQEFKDLSKSYKTASKNAKDLADELRDIDGAGGNLTSNIGNYKSATEGFANSFDALKSGDIKGAFDGIKESVSGLFKTLLENPILGLLSGIVVAGKAIFDFNAGIQESNLLLKGLGVNSADISKVRVELQATADTYGKSFEDIAKTADSLSASYGISISEANDIIAKGLVQGGRANEDFLNQVSEYDVQFERLGFTAEESLAAITAGFEEGVYVDKLPDALKELGLSLEKGTKASRDALTSAFGKEFADKLLNGVQSGSLSVKDALTQIGDESKKVGLNLQQQQQLTGEVFRGAGEDAGGALKIIEILNKSQVRGYTDAEKATEDLRTANEALGTAISNAFEIKGFASGWDSFKASATLTLANIINYLGKLKNDLQPLIDLVGIVLVNVWEDLKTKVTIVFQLIQGALKTFVDFLKDSFAIIKSILSGDFKGVINGVSTLFTNLFNNISNTFNKIRNTIIDGLKGILLNMKPILEAVGVDVEKLNKKLNGLKVVIPPTQYQIDADIKKQDEKDKLKKEKEKDFTEIKPVIDQKAIDDAKKKRDDAQKKLEEERKKELESLQNLANEKVKLAQLELGI